MTSDEVSAAFKKMENLKAGADEGLVAEMLKHGGDDLKSALLDLFNDAIHPDAIHPQDWKTTCIRVPLKSGPPSLVPFRYCQLCTSCFRSL